MLCGDQNRKKKILKRGDIHIHIADSFCCILETNITLLSKYTPIKIDVKGSYYKIMAVIPCAI